MDEDEWMRRIQRALSTAEGFESWTEHVQVPVRNSALHHDDRLCSAFPTSTSAHIGIAVAVDHIGLVRDALTASRATRPYAYYSPVRTATFAAARSVWILSPQYRKQRQSRGLWLEWDSNRKQQGFLNELRTPTDKAVESVATVRADLLRHRELIVAAGAEIGHTLSNKGAPKDYEIMRAATAWVDRHKRRDEFGSGHAALLLWRQHSGAAHGLPWVNFGKTSVVRQLEPGWYEGHVTASVADVGMAVASAVLMTQHAIWLYEKRATKTDLR